MSTSEINREDEFDLDLSIQRISEDIIKDLGLETETKNLVSYPSKPPKISTRLLISIVQKRREVRRELQKTGERQIKTRLDCLNLLMKFQINEFRQSKFNNDFNIPEVPNTFTINESSMQSSSTSDKEIKNFYSLF